MPASMPEGASLAQLTDQVTSMLASSLCLAISWSWWSLNSNYTVPVPSHPPQKTPSLMPVPLHCLQVSDMFNSEQLMLTRQWSGEIRVVLVSENFLRRKGGKRVVVIYEVA